MGIPKSPVPKDLGTSLNSSCCWPWIQIAKIKIDKVWCNKPCPTREDFWTNDVFLWATPNLSTVIQAGLNFDNGLQPNQKSNRWRIYKLTPLEIRCIPLGGLCRIDSRSALSSSSEKPAMVSVDVDFGLTLLWTWTWTEWIPMSLPAVAELRDFVSDCTGWTSEELKMCTVTECKH